VCRQRSQRAKCIAPGPTDISMALAAVRARETSRPGALLADPHALALSGVAEVRDDTRTHELHVLSTCFEAVLSGAHPMQYHSHPILSSTTPPHFSERGIAAVVSLWHQRGQNVVSRWYPIHTRRH
jgi:hypothetical protein